MIDIGTLGPWKACPAEGSSCEWEVVKPDGVTTDGHWWMALCYDAADGMTSKELAQLIAQLPDLLVFVAEVANLNPLYAKGPAKKRIQDAKLLITRATGNVL